MAYDNSNNNNNNNNNNNDNDINNINISFLKDGNRKVITKIANSLYSIVSLTSKLKTEIYSKWTKIA